MPSPDDLTQSTGPLEQPVLDRRSDFGGQDQQRPTTDFLPTLNAVPSEVTDSRPIHRQLVRLRQENKRLHLELEEVRRENKRVRPELEALRSERQQILAELDALQKELDDHVATIHSGHLQEIEHYERHLRELMEERNRLQAAHLELEEHYQELQQSFQDSVEEEARRMLTESTHALECSPDEVPPLLADVVKILTLRLRQEEEPHLLEMHSLKHELNHLTEQVKQERQQLETERQQLLVMQQTTYEQAKLRQAALQDSLRKRWTAKFTAVTLCVLLLLIFLQFLLLSLFRVHTPPLMTLSLIAPIVVCAIVAVLLAYPRATASRVRSSLPRRQTVKKKA
jgi:Fe2+ transport system protein B